MTWQVILSRLAIKDAKKIAQAGLKPQAEKLGILHSSVYTFSNYRRVGRVSESVTRQIVLSVSGYG